MNVPADLQYSKSHEWVRVEGNEAVIGITDFAQSQLGDITYADVPPVDGDVWTDKEMGAVESVKAASDLISPVDGVVIAVNPALENNPEILNADPYGAGWLIKVTLKNAPAGLLNAAQYTEHCASEAH